MERSSRAKHLFELRRLFRRSQLRVDLPRIVEFLRFLLRVEVIEIAKPFVETMHGGQKFISITEMILAKLGGGIALGFQHLRQRRIRLLNAALGTRYADG